MWAIFIAVTLGVAAGWWFLVYGVDPFDHDKVEHNGPLEGE